MMNGKIPPKDIHRRIYSFVIESISFTKLLTKTFQNMILLKQFIRAVTSMGANDQEADGTMTKNDFIAKYSIVRKEAKEAHYWLRLIADTNENCQIQSEKLQNECNEIIKIISTIMYKTKRNT